MANIKGLNAVVGALGKKRKKSKRENNGDVIVGYTANYALRVHEDLEARHAPGKVAKFLHKPAVEKQKEIAEIILRGKKAGLPLMKAIVLGGLFLQRESQKIVPIDTGNLRGSAFTKIEK